MSSIIESHLSFDQRMGKNVFLLHGAGCGRAMVLGIFQCRGVLMWITVGQGPFVLGVMTFLLSSIISLFFLPLPGRRPGIN